MSQYGYRPPAAAGPGGPGGPANLPPVFPKLDIGDVFQSSASIIGANFPAFVLVALMFAVPGTVLSSLASANQMDSQLAMQQSMMNGNMQGVMENLPIGPALLSIAIGLLNGVLIYMGMGTLMFASVEHMAGRRPSIGDVISRGLSQAPSVAVVALIIIVAQFVAVIPGIVAFVLGAFAAVAAQSEGLLCCLAPFGFLIMVVPIAYLVVLFFLAIPVAVVEQTGPFKALGRSIELTKGHRGIIFAVLFLLGLTLLLFVFISGCCIGGATASQLDPTTLQVQETGFFAMAISFVLGMFMSVIRIMVIAAIAAVIYARIRGLKDGVDANAIAQVFS